MSNDDTTAEVRITGDSSGAEAAMARAVVAVSSGATTMRESMNALTSVFSTLQSKMIVISGILAGGAAFKESIEKVQTLNDDSLELSRSLGITAEAANVLQVAMGNAFVEADTYTVAVRTVTKTLNANESAFKQMGVTVRTATGSLRPMQDIITDTVEALQQYSAGAERNVMAQQMLGKSYAEVLKLARLTPEVMKDAAQEIKDYHKTLDPEAVMRYKVAMENVGDVVEGFQVVLGKTVMPMLSELAEWFSSIGPSAVTVFDEAMGVLKIAFDTVSMVVKTMWSIVSGILDNFTKGINIAFGDESMNTMQLFINMVKVIELAFLGLQFALEQFGNVVDWVFEHLKTLVFSWVESASAALKLDFDEASAAWDRGLTEVDKVLEEHAQKAADINAKYAQKAQEIITPKDMPKVADVSPKGGDKKSFDIKESSKGKTKTNDYSLELDNMKSAFELQNNLRKYDLANEITFWQDKLNISKAGSQEYAEISKKLNEAKLKQMQEAAKQAKDMASIEIDEQKNAAMAKLAIDSDNAKAELDLGRLTQEQYLALERQFEDRRYEIAKAALDARLQLLLTDPNSTPAEKARINAEMEALEAEHGQKLNALRIQEVKESQRLFTDLSESMSNLWDKGLDAMMNGTLRWSNAYKAILAEVGKVFLNFAMQKAKNWLTTEVLQTVYTRTQGLVRLALEKMGLLQSATMTATTATAKVGANAAVAGSGAASAMASIPYAGPVLAIAAMAAMLASVGGLKGSIKSARNGYDIPAGINPMVQLHEQEMVLPKAQANAVRDIASGGGGGGGGGNISISIHAMDTAGVKKFVMDNQVHIAEAVRQQVRNGGRIPT